MYTSSDVSSSLSFSVWSSCPTRQRLFKHVLYNALNKTLTCFGVKFLENLKSPKWQVGYHWQELSISGCVYRKNPVFQRPHTFLFQPEILSGCFPIFPFLFTSFYMYINTLWHIGKFLNYNSGGACMNKWSLKIFFCFVFHTTCKDQCKVNQWRAMITEIRDIRVHIKSVFEFAKEEVLTRMC